MIIRCDERYGGRYCVVCGKCTCVTLAEVPVDEIFAMPRIWAPAGSDPACPLHGGGVEHGRTKVVSGKRELRSAREDREGVQERIRRMTQ